MVVGMITIGTCYGDADIPVELLGKGPRPGTVWVKALGDLEPFTKISHGGPYQGNTDLVALASVRDVHLEKRADRKSVNLTGSEPEVKEPVPVQDWFLESAYESRVGDE